GDSVGRGAADEEVDAAGAGAGGFQGGGEDAAGGVADVGDVVGVGGEVGGLGRHRAQGEAAGQRNRAGDQLRDSQAPGVVAQADGVGAGGAIRLNVRSAVLDEGDL